MQLPTLHVCPISLPQNSPTSYFRLAPGKEQQGDIGLGNKTPLLDKTFTETKQTLGTSSGGKKMLGRLCLLDQDPVIV